VISSRHRERRKQLIKITPEEMFKRKKKTLEEKLGEGEKGREGFLGKERGRLRKKAGCMR